MAPTHNYGTPNRDYGMRLATTPPEQDGPLLMVNLMRYRERAAYADGDHGISGREADDRYSPTEVLAAIGAEVVLFGDVDAQLVGASPRWDRVGCVLYPTRRAFIEMQSRPDFQDKHQHKAAGMAETIVMGCLPKVRPALADELAEVDWSAVPHPPTADDPPVVVMHVIRFHEGARDLMDGYHDVAFHVGRRNGARVGGWYDVEGTILGDGRSWDEVRFNVFPSKAAFLATVMDPERIAAQKEHREPAIADTYALIVRPQINRLPGVR